MEATATEIALINKGHLLMHTSPEQLLQSVDGYVWEWVFPSADLPAVREQYLISSTIRRSDGVHVRVVAEQPPAPDAQPTSPTLEDAYLHTIVSANRGEPQ